MLNHVQTTGKVVNTVGNAIEHAVDRTKSALVIEEHQSQDQILDSGHPQ